MTCRVAIPMVGAVLLVGPAFATPPESAPEDAELYARLLGPDSEASAKAAVSAGRFDAPTAEPMGLPTSWIVGLGALALGLAAVRKPLMAAVQTTAGDPEPSMTVVARERLGGMGAASGLLTLLDVQDASGETRRLLIGSGGDGPQLVADLSIGTAAFTAELEASLAEEEEA